MGSDTADAPITLPSTQAQVPAIIVEIHIYQLMVLGGSWITGAYRGLLM